MKLLDKIISAIFPPDIKCVVCGRDMQEGNLCKDCEEKLRLNARSRCVRCGRAITGEGEYCLECMDAGYAFEKVVSAFDYIEDTVTLVYRFKFGGKKYLSSFFAKHMAQAYKESGIESDVIVPVPVTAKTRRSRGYCQTELVAEELSKFLGLPVSKNLIKIKETPEQARLAYKDRLKNLEHAFAAPDKRELSGKRILLVDDVYTTGATADECSRTLVKAGALEVNVLVGATTPQSRDYKKRQI